MNKFAVTLAAFGLILTVVNSLPDAQAARLPNGTKLTIAPGIGSDNRTPCPTGSCWALEVATGVWLWENINPGTTGGLIVGVNQKSGGQEIGTNADGTGSATNNKPSELNAAFFVVSNYGSFATAPMKGTAAGSATSDASKNFFDDASCSKAGCLGKTQLGTWHVAWNGIVNALGSDGGCTSLCTPDRLAGIGVTNWVVNPDRTYKLDYDWAPPTLDTSVFGYAFRLRLAGTIIPPPPPVVDFAFQSPNQQVLVIFGSQLLATTGVAVNGVDAPVFGVINNDIIWALIPSSVPKPWKPGTVDVTTSSGTGHFPKACVP